MSASQSNTLRPEGSQPSGIETRQARRARERAAQRDPTPAPAEEIDRDIHEVEDGQSDPEGPTLDQELETLRKWKENQLKLLELKRLKEMKAKFMLGDLSALYDAGNGMMPARTPQQSATAGLPRPEPPEKFSKANRAQYNRWERDCESYFLRVPLGFETEAQKVDFGIRYISEPLKTLWSSYCEAERLKNFLWIPTWADLKKVMLNSLGTPQERKQLAYDCLKRAQQRYYQSPTDLLDYMRPLWEELGSSRTPDVQVLEYTAALREDIRKSLLLLPPDRRNDLPQVEEHANLIYRQKNQNRDNKDKPTKNGDNQPKKEAKERGGPRKPPINRRKPKSGQNDAKRPKTNHSGRDVTKVTCYTCGETGHYSASCEKAKKADDDKVKPSNPKSGKESGRS